ncbi:MAG: adenylylsulfate kinase [Bacillota bacterium]
MNYNRDKAEFVWTNEELRDLENIPGGDMPGDKIIISTDHVQKARIIMPRLLELLMPAIDESPYRRAVVAVCGVSGVGKSEVASLLSFYLNSMNIGSYILSGDNYPHRIPKYNDAERLMVFRRSGIKGLICHGKYTEECRSILKELQKSGNDLNPDCFKNYPWLSIYLDAGRDGLRNYLGTKNEIDFDELTEIVSQFKNGANRIFLKRMGREETELWYDCVDFSDINVLVIEWTHGNSPNLQGVDIPIMLSGTPRETLEHRKSRKRDEDVDSQFTNIVLDIEQEILVSQESRAKLIVSGSGEILP